MEFLLVSTLILACICFVIIPRVRAWLWWGEEGRRMAKEPTLPEYLHAPSTVKTSITGIKIPIIRLENAINEEDSTLWVIVARVRYDMDYQFIEKIIDTYSYEELDLAKKMAIRCRNSGSDFTRDVTIVQKLIDDEFC